jgi:hypothetical protein
MVDGIDREDEADPQAGIDESAGADGLKDDLEVESDALDSVTGGFAVRPLLEW